jgi:hypothetical protein
MARLAAVLAVFDAAVFLNEFPHHGGLELMHRFLVAIDARGTPGIPGRRLLLLGDCHSGRDEQNQSHGEPPQVSHMSHRFESSAGPAILGRGQLVIRLLTSP